MPSAIVTLLINSNKFKLKGEMRMSYHHEKPTEIENGEDLIDLVQEYEESIYGIICWEVRKERIPRGKKLVIYGQLTDNTIEYMTMTMAEDAEVVVPLGHYIIAELTKDECIREKNNDVHKSFFNQKINYPKSMAILKLHALLHRSGFDRKGCIQEKFQRREKEIRVSDEHYMTWVSYHLINIRRDFQGFFYFRNRKREISITASLSRATITSFDAWGALQSISEVSLEGMLDECDYIKIIELEELLNKKFEEGKGNWSINGEEILYTTSSTRLYRDI